MLASTPGEGQSKFVAAKRFQRAIGRPRLPHVAGTKSWASRVASSSSGKTTLKPREQSGATASQSTIVMPASRPVTIRPTCAPPGSRSDRKLKRVYSKNTTPTQSAPVRAGPVFIRKASSSGAASRRNGQCKTTRFSPPAKLSRRANWLKPAT